MTEIRRIVVPTVEPAGDANILQRYAIERAGWVWHPDVRVDETAVLLFRNRFTLEAEQTFTVHLSADHRYELTLDGRYVGMGPDRSDVLHWSFASYEMALDAGEHVFEARAWWLGRLAPTAQMSVRGGFIFATDGGPASLNTGGEASGWTVQRDLAWSFEHRSMKTYHVIGPVCRHRGGRSQAQHGEPAAPAVVRGPVNSNMTGVVAAGWQLEPSPLPDMLREPRRVGTVRAVLDAPADRPIDETDTGHAAIADWQALLGRGEPVEVPARTTRQVLIDLEDYYCGYGSVGLDGGAATVAIEWAEALFEVDEQRQRTAHKGQRDAVVGKLFFGFGDIFDHHGETPGSYRELWWRSGRFLRVTVTTAEAPVTLRDLHIIETRYPLESATTWRSDRSALDAIRPMAVRGLQMCSHETFMDCPYYEQLMYVGDTRLEMLTTYVLTGDDRLVKRGIELFDGSRWKTGFVAERYPSEPFQLSLTFSLIWVFMLRDHAWWRDDLAWLRQRRVGMRSLLEHFIGLQRDSGLLGRLPGWSFIDWVPGWSTGMGPGVREGDSSIVNLLFIAALQSAADVEAACGDEAMSHRWRELGEQVGQAVVERFWHEPTGRVADDADHAHFSEHAQCLALLTGVLDDSQRDRALHALLHNDDLARTTVYFSFYLLETLHRFGRGDVLVAKLAFWQDLVAQGFKTPVESPEPSRSDCHAWGSHPLVHMHASLAGVRPDAPGFCRVRVAPTPGPLRTIDATIPHPRGAVSVELRVGDQARITLPPETPGIFVWNGQTHDLPAGETTCLPMPE